MKKNSNSDWLNQIVSYIREHTGNNPGYSLDQLAGKLERKFLLQSEEAAKVAALADKELTMNKLGLAAIELNLTFNCNLACEYCFVHCKTPHDRINFATACCAIDLLMERAVFPEVIITLIGGEPLLEFELIKQIVPYALQQAAKHNLKITWAVTTNGTLISEKILKYFSEHQINMLISIDGGKDTHDRYRKTKSGEGSWQKIADLIPLIKQYQPWLGARMTVSTAAIDSMCEDFNAIVGMGVNQLIIAPAQGEKQWDKKQIEQYGLNMVKILVDYYEYQRKGIGLLIEEFEQDDLEHIGWGCRAGNTSLAIAPNGDASPCSKLLGLTDEAGRYIVGNVHTGIDVKKLEPFRSASSQQPKHCQACSRICAGGCYAVNFEQTGNHFTPSEENCLFWVVGQEIKRMSKSLRYGGVMPVRW